MKKNQKTIKYFIPILTFLVSGWFCCSAEAATVTKEEIIDLVNSEREKAGLNELVENPKLSKAAGLKAQDIIGNNYFAHTSPSGIDPWHWFEEVEYDYKYAGENLGMDFSNALSLHKAWMKSQTHKDNIMSDKYQEIGVAVLSGIMENRETQVAVQLFGKRVAQETLDKQEEVLAQFNQSVDIKEASVSPWKGKLEDEMLVYAEIEGEPQKVEAVIKGNIFPLEKLRDNIYMNLISLKGIDLEENDVILKTSIDDKQAIFYQIPESQYEDYLAAKEEKEEEKTIAGTIGSVEENPTLAKWEYIFKQNILLIIITGVFLVTIINIWILEKEEENLLKSIKSA